MLKPLMPKFRLDLFVRLKDIAEKQVPTKLNPIVRRFDQSHSRIRKRNDVRMMGFLGWRFSPDRMSRGGDAICGIYYFTAS